MRSSLLLLFSLVTLNLLSQIWTNPITGTNPNASNPYTTGQTFNSNVTVSGIGRGAGATGSNANDRYNANSWNTVGIDLTAYFEFTITPNSGCTIDFTNFIYTAQASGTGATSFAFRSSLDGFASNIGTPTSTGATIDLSAATYQGIGSAITFRLYGWGASAAGGTFSINDFTFNGSTSCPSSNTITTGTVASTPFTVTCPSTTASGTVNFTSTGIFTAGNVYTAQLSDATGSFAAPITIGTFSSTANTGTINITIPAGTPTGSGYLIRIVSNAPSTIGSSSTAFTITQTGSCTSIAPYLTSIIYNGCNVEGCDEGQSEIVFGTTADFSLTVNSANININYPGAPAYDLVGTVLSNTATTSSINTDAACPGTFIDAFGLTLPPNSTFIIVPNNLCVSALTWGGLCSEGPIYIIYAQEGTTGNTWHTGGNFGNSSGIKTFDVDFTSSGGSVNTSYDYNPPSNTDGNYATYGASGGTPTTQGNLPNCELEVVVLATDLTYFNAAKENDKSKITWETVTETNNSHFILEHSINGTQWTQLAKINGAGTSANRINYEFIHERPAAGNNYYKLKSVDFDGEIYHKGIVVLNFSGKPVLYDHETQMIHLGDEADIEIYSLDGKRILSSKNQSSIPFTHKGLFIVYNRTSNESYRIVTY